MTAEGPATTRLAEGALGEARGAPPPFPDLEAPTRRGRSGHRGLRRVVVARAPEPAVEAAVPRDGGRP